MQTSVRTYNPDVNLMIFEGFMGNFGDDYNAAMEVAFRDYDEIIIANDDIVLKPDSYELLMADVKKLKGLVGDKLGFVSAKSDDVRGCQHIRLTELGKVYASEAVSPLFAWISKKAFEEAQFPPTNWFSDDIMCHDLNNLGYKHYVSASYVHHVGSTSIGRDVMQLVQEAEPWIKENRPQYHKAWFK
jgi:hypothetical protein